MTCFFRKWIVLVMGKGTNIVGGKEKFLFHVQFKMETVPLLSSWYIIDNKVPLNSQ